MAQDQITFSISPEYFTLIKFEQFAWADPGLANPRWFVGIIGLIAGGSGGLIAGWVLARLMISRREVQLLSIAAILGNIWILPVTMAIFGLLGWVTGRSITISKHLEEWMIDLGVTELKAFSDVMMIHNFSYVGAVAGIIVLAKLGSKN